MNSLASANGPSMTLRCPPASCTLAPAALGASPAVSSSAPAAVASAPRFTIASISPGGGSASWVVPLSRIRYRIVVTPVAYR
jgi:hypothetical protein